MGKRERINDSRNFLPFVRKSEGDRNVEMGREGRTNYEEKKINIGEGNKTSEGKKLCGRGGRGRKGQKEMGRRIDYKEKR